MKHDNQSSPNTLRSHTSDFSHLLVSAKQAAKLLSISERMLWQRTAEFEIPCVRIGRRNLYSIDALKQWIASKAEGGKS